MSKPFFWLKNFFVPHADNDFSPFCLRKKNIVLLIVALIAIEIVHYVQILIFGPSSIVEAGSNEALAIAAGSTNSIVLLILFAVGFIIFIFSMIESKVHRHSMLNGLALSITLIAIYMGNLMIFRHVSKSEIPAPYSMEQNI